jgi:hypothetical protein
LGDSENFNDWKKYITALLKDISFPLPLPIFPLLPGQHGVKNLLLYMLLPTRCSTLPHA